MEKIRNFFSIKRNIYITVGILVILIFGIVLLFASSSQKPQTQTSIQNEKVSLVWWKPFYGRDVYEEIISDFKKIPGNQNIDIQLVTKEYNDDYYKSLISDIARGAGPDIFTIRNDDLPAYKEFMSPIQLFSGEILANYKDSFTDLAVKDTIDKDKVYAITSYIDNLQLYYNKNLISQNGIALPPRTWSELDRQIPFLNKRNVNTNNFDISAISLGTGGRGLEGSPNINRHEDIIPMLIFQSGGQLFDTQTNSIVFGSTANKNDQNSGLATSESLEDGVDKESPSFRAIKFYTDFANLSSSRYTWNTSSNQNIDAFVEGKLAYMIHFSYAKDLIKNRNSRLPFDIAPLPQLDTNIKKTYGFFFMDGINRKLETDTTQAVKKEAAEKFLYYLSLPEAQQKFVAKTKLPASRKDIISEQISGDDQIRIFAEGSLYSDNYYKPNVVKTEKIWSDLVERIQYDGQPVSESIDEAIKEYRLIVQQGPKLR
jgi:ABC-type glycerol-3-phosphate transport system substrate-binding protein